MYGNSLLDMKILLIPAGGYSQRLPNFTCLGKLFCPLPFGDANYQMLDLILATYLPFLTKMQPGVLLASSDAIISYSLSTNGNLYLYLFIWYIRCISKFTYLVYSYKIQGSLK